MKKLMLFLIFMSIVSVVLGSGQFDISYSPYTVTTSGSYILVRDLVTPINQNGITLSADNVSIDFNGHTLYGAGSTTGSGGYGIYNNIPADNIAIYNGTIRDFRTMGIYISGENCDIQHMMIYFNGSDAINIGSNGIVCNNNIRANGGDGINGGQGDVIRDNSIRQNGGDGIQISGSGVIMGNAVYNNGLNGIRANSSSVIKNNVSISNLQYGIYVLNYCQVIENNCYSNNVGVDVAGNYSRIDNNLMVSNITGLRIESSSNYHGGNVLKSNTVETSVSASNTEGTGVTGGFRNVVPPQFQPNYLVTQYAGFYIPALHESPQAILRNLKW